MRALAIVPFILFLTMATPAAGESPAGSAPEIGAAALHARMQAGSRPLVVDMRTPEEFALGHLPGAVNVPHDQVAARLGELTTKAEIVAYCTAGGARSRQGEAALLAAGRSVLHLTGGFVAWQQEGLPVEPEP